VADADQIEQTHGEALLHGVGCVGVADGGKISGHS
ncbi:MAG: hypothetical protein ACI9KS_000787, partial [Sulfitobacter sp.]